MNKSSLGVEKTILNKKKGFSRDNTVMYKCQYKEMGVKTKVS